MIDSAKAVRDAMLQASVSFVGDISKGSYFVTEMPVMTSLEEGMMVVSEMFPENTKIVSIGSNYLECDRLALDDGADEVIYAGYGLDVCFRDVEVHEAITCGRWKYLDSDECLTRQFPMVEILTSSTETGYLNEDAPSLLGYDVDYIDIYVSNIGTDPIAVKLWIDVFAIAVKKLLYIDNTLGEQFMKVRRVRADYSEVFQIKDEGEYLKLLVQTIAVWRDAIES